MIIASTLGILIQAALSVFQVLLIFGKPLGYYAWGGQHEVLPQYLRFASAVSIVLYVLFIIFLASRAGIVNIISDGPVLNIVMWVLTSYFVIGVFMNAISRSKKERVLMTPVALSLAVIFLLVTLS